MFHKNIMKISEYFPQRGGEGKRLKARLHPAIRQLNNVTNSLPLSYMTFIILCRKSCEWASDLSLIFQLRYLKSHTCLSVECQFPEGRDVFAV